MKENNIEIKSKRVRIIMILALSVLALLFVFPTILVFMNSLKNKLYISDQPFAFPFAESFVGLSNYVNGIIKTGLITAALRSLFITTASVIFMILLTSMCAWWLTRVKNRIASVLYFCFVFSMIVPFQLVMFTLAKVTDTMNLGNMLGIILVYTGFGAGLSIFLFSGFIKGIPISLEEAAMMDGCTPIQTFFRVVFPVLRPTIVTVVILQSMWIWNDFLLPTLVLDNEKPTIPMAVQYLRGGYGSIDMGAMMAMLVLAIIPIIILYLCCQKYIIQGITAGAVKG